MLRLIDVRSGTVVTADKITCVGRSSESDIRIPFVDVSRRHCLLIPSRLGGWFVADCGSHNGTFVNDVRVAGLTRVRKGDRVSMGAMTFEVQSAEGAAEPGDHLLALMLAGEAVASRTKESEECSR